MSALYSIYVRTLRYQHSSLNAKMSETSNTWEKWEKTGRKPYNLALNIRLIESKKFRISRSCQPLKKVLSSKVATNCHVCVRKIRG
jgi:hypothetical protein